MEGDVAFYSLFPRLYRFSLNKAKLIASLALSNLENIDFRICFSLEFQLEREDGLIHCFHEYCGGGEGDAWVY